MPRPASVVGTCSADDGDGSPADAEGGTDAYDAGNRLIRVSEGGVTFKTFAYL